MDINCGTGEQPARVPEFLSSRVTEDGLRSAAEVLSWRSALPGIGRAGAGATLFAAILAILLRLPSLRQTPVWEIVLLLVCVFLSRAVPVVLAREKPVTFTAAMVFGAALMVGGAAAALSALTACILHGYLTRRRFQRYQAFLGAQYALAALASESVYLALARAPSVEPPAVGNVILAAAAFIVVNALLVAFGAMSVRHGDPVFKRSVLLLQASTYAVSFPLAILMVAAYPALHHAALVGLAGVLAVSAYTVRTSVENRVLRRQLWTVEKLGRACANEVRVEAPLKQFLSLARELVAYERAVLWVFDDQTAMLRPRVMFPETVDPAESGLAGPETILGRVAERNEPLITTNTWSDPFRDTDGEGESWMLHPLTHLGRPLGVAQFVRGGSLPFTKADVARLGALVPQAAVAFETVRVRHEMFRYRDKSVTDSLTGLLNHQSSKNQLRLEVERAQRYFRSVSILMIDVDGFKSFNDTYGHPQGDVLLISLARILRNAVRTVDHVGRYGGEEFIVILPETSRSDAQILAERIRAAIASQVFQLLDGQEVQRTVSIGVAGYPDDAMDSEQLVQHADDALYRAKRAGRNCVLTA